MLEYFNQDDYVINIGDIGDRAFLILHGEVSVQIDNENKIEEVKAVIAEEQKNESV